MLLTLTSTAPEASDLGFLLHKHPAKVQSFPLPTGTAHVFYPEATAQRCTVALLLEVDPVALVRRRAGASGFSLAPYVNDRPYASSSMLAAALGKVFRTAISGACTARPELAAQALPLVVEIPALPARGGGTGGDGDGGDLVSRLFQPLGWDVDVRSVPLDLTVPAWGASRYVELRLTGTLRLADALSQLYVLLPVLDADKHYWVGPDEIDKLLRAGEGWLPGHPERDLIAHRYLANQRDLAAAAVERMDADEASASDRVVVQDLVPPAPASTSASTHAPAPAALAGPAVPAVATVPPVPPVLSRLRADAVVGELREAGARTVVDLGCGEGALIARLLEDRSIERVLGVDVSHRALEKAAARLRLDTMPERQRARVELAQSSLTYTDARVAGFDAAVLMEVVEHVDPPRLAALERAVLAVARPRVLVVTTPNAEHNVRYDRLERGQLRHHDHRFEWTRAEFEAWAAGAAERHGYEVRFAAVGPVDPEVGPPTQMAVLTRTAPEDGESA